MREVWSQEAVEPRAGDCRQDRHHKHGRSAADQRDERARTRTRQRPAEAEDRTTDPIAASRPEALRRDRNLLSGQRADLEPSDQGDRGRRQGYGRADDAVHVERLKPEHLLDPEPGDDLGLREHEAEDDPEEKVDEHRLPRGRRRPELGGNGGGHHGSEEQREHDERRDQPACEESDHRDERSLLEVRESRDRVSGGAAAGVGGAEPDQEPPDDDHDDPAGGRERRPAERLAGHEARQVVQAERGQRRLGLGGEGNAPRGREPSADKTAQERPGEEGKIPGRGLLPVVPEERDLAGEAGRANVPQVAREAERLVAQEQEDGDHQPDERAPDVPGPGAGEQVGHDANIRGSSRPPLRLEPQGASYPPPAAAGGGEEAPWGSNPRDRESTRLNSSHGYISYAAFCFKKKKKTYTTV